MKEQVIERLGKLRQRMKAVHLDAYIVLDTDFHASEYVGGFFKSREYISGFTGSAGSVVILPDEAGLWTDGRYFLQAEQELAGSGITLYRIGEENVPTLEAFLTQKLEQGACVGIDGRTLSGGDFCKWKKELDKKQISVRMDCDLVGDIWQDRPKMSCEAAWELKLCYAGKKRSEKLAQLQEKLLEKRADCTIISSLDDIAWILNVRGNDIPCTPVVLSFLIVEKEQAVWFVQPEAVHTQLALALQADGVILQDYHRIYEYVSKELAGQSVYVEPDRTNMLLFLHLHEASCHVIKGKNLTLLLKAVKNQTELDNMRKAHIKDAAACIKFIYWLKTQMAAVSNKRDGENLQQQPITEMSAADKLEDFRRQQEHYLGPSFDTIAGYAHHGAIVHYSAAPDTNIPLRPENFVLIDSGGHYLEGTTDITRTIALGTVTEEQKHHYTLVLKGHLKLGAAKFKYGCAGINLDYLARESLWQEGLDYNHGTGHGVGCLLNVHEPPNCFRSKVTAGREECTKLEPGMITSNEPGLYFAEKYGIRIENLIVCKEIESNAYGRFLGFEPLTLVPYERDAVVVEELTDRERELLNQYHAAVYQLIGPYLESEERAWLKEVTAEV